MNWDLREIRVLNFKPKGDTGQSGGTEMSSFLFSRVKSSHFLR